MSSNIASLNSELKRHNFGKIKLSDHQPDLLEIQLKSFKEFFQLETTPENRINEGLYRVFQENFPISDARNIFVLEFLDYYIDPPRYDIDECMQRGLTYSLPLRLSYVCPVMTKNMLTSRLLFRMCFWAIFLI